MGREQLFDTEKHQPVAANLPTDFKTLANKVNEYVKSGDKFFSLEYFPPRTPNGAVNLVARFDRMSRGGPLFCDITWHPAGDPGSDKETSSITIASIASNYCGLETMLHMTCANQKTKEVLANLNKAKHLGLRNILALRGDPVVKDGKFEVVDENLQYGSDMTKLIRKEFGDYFTICVAGYPQGHPDCPSYEDSIQHLKIKVNAGADFIITQLFFETATFLKFVKDCRAAGIMCPILPGVMPIQAYASLRQLAKLSQLEIPQYLIDIVEPLKNNDDAIRKFGVDFAVKMCRELLESNEIPGIHFYTLNRELATKDILKQLGLWKKYSICRTLPWKASSHTKRIQEDVRPIFWATRPKSYIHRTSNWDEYPNGRWGNSASPSFAELTDHHLFYLRSPKDQKELRKMWGEQLENLDDVYRIFDCYLSGEANKQGNKVLSLPFNDDELMLETSDLLDDLREVNRNGFLTINSQPAVNGCPSTDEKYGWGGAGGYIYQKAYLEFFTHKDNVEALVDSLKKDYPHVNYHCIDAKGLFDVTNADAYSPIAVTWGVFPGKEIQQPTVVDRISFHFWKDEAYSLWQQQWQKLYEPESQGWKVIDDIVNNFYLVNMVDNNYQEDSCLFDIIKRVIARQGSEMQADGGANNIKSYLCTDKLRPVKEFTDDGMNVKQQATDTSIIGHNRSDTANPPACRNATLKTYVSSECDAEK